MWGKFKALLKIKNLYSAFKEAHGSGFDFKVAFLKMGKTVAWVALGLLITHYSTPDALAALLGVLPDNLEKLLLPMVVAAMTGAQNWYKNKDNEQMLVVPLGAPEATPISVSVRPAAPPSTTPSIPQSSGI